MITSPNSCFIRPNKKKTEADLAKGKFQHDQGDHLTLLRVFNAFAECGSKLF
jgi:pre-mRNA-splicing factor ATP-dependent RNA helicase DHX15/PRP43